MFGQAITNGALVAPPGTYGYVVGFDLSTLNVATIQQVQMQNGALVYSDPVTSPTSIDDLYASPETSSCPDVAFAVQGNFLFVFLKTTVYAFIADNKIGFWFLANATAVDATTDMAKFPKGSKQLLSGLVLQSMYLMQSEPIPFAIDDLVRSEKGRLAI